MSTSKRVKVWRDADQQWRFTVWSSSDKVATSGEGHLSKGHVLEQVESLFPGIPVEVEGEGE